eukprot:877620_1
MANAYSSAMKQAQGMEVMEHGKRCKLNVEQIKLWRCRSSKLDDIVSENLPLFADRDKRNAIDDVLIDVCKARVSGVNDERMFLLEITIHCCDIANPSKPLHIANKWANMYSNEIFQQGDKEREMGIEISFGADRKTTKLAESQYGFITKMVQPLFEPYAYVVDAAEHCLMLLRKNANYWHGQMQLNDKECVLNDDSDIIMDGNVNKG